MGFGGGSGTDDVVRSYDVDHSNGVWIMTFGEALRATSDEIYQRREEVTEISEYEAGRRDGVDDTLDDLRLTLLEDYQIPAVMVAAIVNAVKERGES